MKLKKVRIIPSFNNLNQLYKHLEKNISASLADNVAKKAEKTMQEEIKTEVYGVYSPVSYQRKYYEGGLIDPENIKTTMLTGDTLQVENIRHDGNKNVTAIVESGYGYTHNVPDRLREGRPFTAKTEERLRDEGIALEGLRLGLNQRGVGARYK